MKKILLVSLVSFMTLGAFAQNLQLHYDCGRGRGYLTSTVEMFRPDKLGSTFFFVDMDYGSNDLKGVTLGYWEIARSFKVSKKSNFEVRGEYNGGVARLTPSLTIPINNAYLVGGQYTWNNADFSKVFTLQGNYKYIQDKNDASSQITGVWGFHFFKRKLSLVGFADFWKEDNIVFDNDGNAHETKFVFLTEPQFWYNVTPKFSLGSEVEISSNFAGNYGFMVNPTIAAKYTF